MTTTQLSRVTLETLANYRVAATQTAAATGAGGTRLVRAVNGTLVRQFYPRAAKLAPRATARLHQVGDEVNRRVVDGIEAVVERTEAVIDRSSEMAVTQVNRIAGMAAAVGNPLVADGLNTAARLSLPMAQLALAVSSRVAEGATSLAHVAGASSRAHRRVVAVARKGRAQAAVSAKRVRKAAAEVVKAPAVKRARRAVKKAAAKA